MEESGLKAHATAPDGTPQDAAISTNIEGAAGIVTLNRPRALNALTAAMRAQIAAAFAAWARDPQVYAAVIVSATDRAFCAGGDVREMVEHGKVAARGGAPLDRGGVCAQLAARLLHQAYRVADRRHGDGFGRGHHALRHAPGGWRTLSLRDAGNGHRPVSRRRGELGVCPHARRDRHVPGVDRPRDRAR